MKTKTVVILLLSVICVVILAVVIRSGSKKTDLAKKEKSELTKKTPPVKKSSDPIAWNLRTFAGTSSDQSNKKYIETTTEGIFSDPATKRGTLYVQVVLTKMSAGFLLHKSTKANPSLKIEGTASITLKNQNPEELKLSSIEQWAAGGGIKIRNHGENKHLAYYDQLKDFMDKSTGNVLVTITDENSSTYSFYIRSGGFSKMHDQL